MKTLKFTKEKITTNARVNDLLVNEIVLIGGKEGMDFINETFTLQLQSFILSRLNDLKTITVTGDRPTFLDWLLRRRPVFNIEVECKEVLKNPPSLEPGRSELMYSIREEKDV